MTTTTTTIGEQLKQARLARKLTFQDVTRDTKIQSWILQALEADRIHETTSPIYAKGFLLTYAKFLRLDAKTLVQEWVARHGAPPVPDAAPSQPEDLGNAEPVQSRPASVTWNVSWPEIPWSALKQIGVAAVSVVAILVLVKTDPIQKFTARLRRQEASLATVKKKIPTPARDTALHLEPTQPLELSIVVQQPTWVSIIADGHLLAQEQLAAGTKEKWTARKRFDVVVAKPAQVEILLNGHSISPFAMAHQGRLSITHSSIKPLATAAAESAE